MRTPDEVADSIARRSTIKDPNSPAFTHSGEEAAETIARHLEGHLPPGGARVLDFGCASGRVLLPLSRRLPGSGSRARTSTPRPWSTWSSRPRPTSR